MKKNCSALLPLVLMLFVGGCAVNNNYLRAADYYVSASRTEGMPLGVLEAMAEGLPLLLSDIPALCNDL